MAIPSDEKENQIISVQGVCGTKSAWKPADQPTWRGGAATIWEKPVAVQTRERTPVMSVVKTRQASMIDEDPYRGWSSPLELRNQQEAAGLAGAPLGAPTGGPLATGAAKPGSNGAIPADWFESSDEEDFVVAAVGGGGPDGTGQRGALEPVQPRLPLRSEQQCVPVNTNIKHETPPERDEGEDLYEDWYYERRPMLRGTPIQDLASCSTTTGGIKVCRNAARHWVYPAHIPERKYQLHAISRALFSNTLVCYPTGLGKTLIAAVVMHNFFRWFPTSKVVFIAPTKPLVAQQMKACQKFMGLHESNVSEMTGKASGESRKAAWNSETVRVYFCTPQTFWNDVKRGICPYDLISCIVVDECHRATGQADIVKAVKDMRNAKKCKFRVLGLSATPGSSHEQVQEVIDSLGISTLVFKDETDKDVAPYVHNKRSEVVVVNPECAGNASRCMLMATLQRIVGDLSSNGLYYGVADAERVTRFGLQHARKSCKKTSWAVTGQFIQAQILADVRDQLDGYGARTALSFLQSKMVQERHMKALHSSDPQFAHFVSSLQRVQGSNPKLEKLREILHEFFTSGQGDLGPATFVPGHPACRRAIIFASLRDGVASIAEALESMNPLVRAKMFIGQGGGKGQTGMKQSEQKQVLADFSSGACNLLVATCIGEEGLDIPNVDLIVCFDAISSPTRALQRQGRTGRHGDGRVIYLLTAGQEEDRFNKSAIAMRKLHAQLKEAEQYFVLNENAVRMLPREFGIPKMAHLVEDADPMEMRNESADPLTAPSTAGVGRSSAPAMPGAPPHATPHTERCDRPPRSVMPVGPASVVDLVDEIDNEIVDEHVGGDNAPLSTGVPPAPPPLIDPQADLAVVEEMSLMERLELMKARPSTSRVMEHDRLVNNQEMAREAGIPGMSGKVDARRRRQVISSQSTPSSCRPPVMRSPSVGGISPMSLENLSIKRTTPQQLSRLCRAGDQKSVASKVNKKRRCGVTDISRGKLRPVMGVFGGPGGDTSQQHARARQQTTANNESKRPCRYLDDEASLSGEDSGDEGDDMVANPSLQAFFDDATQDGSPAIHGIHNGNPYGCDEESPGIMNVLARVRSRRQQCHLMVDTQSQELSRATPNEYDLDDSFLADSDDEDL